MKARDIFGLILRIIGLLVILYCGWNIEAAFYCLLSGEPFGAYFIYGVPGVVLGILLLFLARYIVRLSYPENKDDSDA